MLKYESGTSHTLIYMPLVSSTFSSLVSTRVGRKTKALSQGAYRRIHLPDKPPRKIHVLPCHLCRKQQLDLDRCCLASADVTGIVYGRLRVHPQSHYLFLICCHSLNMAGLILSYKAADDNLRDNQTNS